MTDSETKLRDRQAELIKILEAIELVLKNKGWQTLKELVFDGVVESLNRQLLSEAKKPKVLQGEMAWARRYSNLKSYAEMLQKELQGIKDNQK